MRPHPRSAAILLACAFVASACSKKEDKAGDTTGTSPAKKTIRVTGIPDENPTELQRKFEPMVNFLSAKLDAKVEYIPLVDYGAAVQALAANKVDFAWLGGFTFVQARVMAGAVPLVMRDIDREFKSVFIANAASKVEKMEDIKGKKLAFGSKSSTSGHLMPRHFMISEFKLDPDKDLAGAPVHTDAHDATAKMVQSGKVDVGALNVEVWERLVRERKVNTDKVKVIWTTPPYVDYVWAASKNVPEDVRKKFSDAFLALTPDRSEDKVVLALQNATKFVPASNEDFDAVEQIGRSTGLIK